MKWLKQNWTFIAIIAIGIFIGRGLFPRTVNTGRTIPQIVTQYDTVHTVWHDTVKVTHFTTDTFNLITREVIYDTVVINVTTDRPNLWPVISYDARNSKDSANVRTFSLQRGWGAVSSIYTPGPLVYLQSDSTSSPHMTFGVWPEHHTSFITKLFYTGVGYGACTLSNYVARNTR